MRGVHHHKEQVVERHQVALPEASLEVVPSSMRRIMDGLDVEAEKPLGEVDGSHSVRTHVHCHSGVHPLQRDQPVGFLALLLGRGLQVDKALDTEQLPHLAKEQKHSSKRIPYINSHVGFDC